MSTAEWKPASAAELGRMLAENFQQEQHALIPVGGRTSFRSGGPISQAAVQIVTSELDQVIDYPARDMTITVEAGMRIEDLVKHLATENQRLPIDISQGHRATIGGAIAANTSGPGRYGYGTFRDYVIGISAVDGQGRLFSAGGRVVKNVAGYDLCKLLVGSQGALAVITQVTLKLRPLAEARRILVVTPSSDSDFEAVLTTLNTSAARPVALEILNRPALAQLTPECRQSFPSDATALMIACDGSAREVDWQMGMLEQELRSGNVSSLNVLDAEMTQTLWGELVEFPVSSDDPLSFRASMLPSHVTAFLRRATDLGIAVQAHAGNGIVHGHLQDTMSDVDAASQQIQQLRASAESGHGRLTVTSCDDEWKETISVFGDALPAQPIMQRVKMALDPAGVLSPGRFWPADSDRGAATTAN